MSRSYVSTELYRRALYDAIDWQDSILVTHDPGWGSVISCCTPSARCADYKETAELRKRYQDALRGINLRRKKGKREMKSATWDGKDLAALQMLDAAREHGVPAVTVDQGTWDVRVRGYDGVVPEGSTVHETGDGELRVEAPAEGEGGDDQRGI